MPKFILTSVSRFEHSNKIILEFEKENLLDVLKSIELFLKGSGYVFDGHLDFVDESSTEKQQLLI